MKFSSKLGIIALTGLMLVSCSNKKGFRIEGTLENGADKNVQILVINKNRMVPADSAQLDKKEHFVLSGELEQPTFAIFQTLKNHFITLILHPGDKITIEGNYDDIENNHSVKGSEDTRLYEEFSARLKENIDKLQELNKIYRNNSKSPNFDSILNDLNIRSKAILDTQKVYTQQFVKKHLNSMVSLLVLYQQIAPGTYILDPMKDFTYYKMVDSSLMKSYPQSDPVITFHAQMAQLRARHEQEEIANRTLGIGKVPPDIALPTPKGDTLRLSSLHGKVVLLDFWASWCSPCRRENPNIVKTYNRFHRKGFDILQVSLDRTKEAWLNGIKQDHLEQWHHVSDLGYWQSSVVQLYHIQGIPTNYLLNRDGKIIAKNLRGQALAQKLEEILGK
ncbi:MAG TPA: AhpC/TSA family protein [Bacteroidetes bacterium]|nr:AhpC/TSA family protein [Bacteroidota bacterium]